MKPPNLQELVERAGGYDRISPEEWRKFDAQSEAFRSYMRRPVSRIVAASRGHDGKR